MNGALYLLMEDGIEDISNLFDALYFEDIQGFLNLVNKSNIPQIKKASNKVKAALQLMNEIMTSKKSKFKSKSISEYSLELDSFKMPMHYALENNDLELFKLITENLSEKEVNDSLSYLGKDKETVASCIQHNLLKNEELDEELQQHKDIQERIQNFNLFLPIKISYFRYYPIELRFKNKDLIHPLIYMIQKQEKIEDSVFENADMTNSCSFTTGYNFIDQLFVIGAIGYMTHKDIRPVIEAYLRDNSNLKKIEKIINSDFPEMKAKNDSQRMAKFLLQEFGVKIKAETQKVVSRAKIVYQFKRIKDDYLASSQKCLDQLLDNIKKEQKSRRIPEGTVDSIYYWDLKGVVIKDEETGRYFDAYRTKIDVSKTYYGVNSYYNMQLLKENSKKLYILLTHWGRTGTDGERQRTPFKDYETAKKEFGKLFKSKFKYKWEEAHLFSESIRNR